MDFSLLTADQLQFAAEMLKAMAHPLRIELLNLLNNEKELTVSQIQNFLKIDQAIASHHLLILKNRMILGSRRDGKNIYYFVNNEHLGDILQCLNKCACLKNK